MEFYEAAEGYIASECPTCQSRLLLRPEAAGTTVKCDTCYRLLPIPAPLKVRPKKAIIQPQAEPYALQTDDVAASSSRPDPPGAPPHGSLDEPVVPVPDGPRSGGYGIVDAEEPSPMADTSAKSSTAGQGITGPPVTEQRSGRSAVGQSGGRSDSSTTQPGSRSDPTTARSNPPTEDTPKRRKEAFALHCAQCGNRMWARLHQVGQEIACGTCGQVMVVPSGPADGAGSQPRTLRSPLATSTEPAASPSGVSSKPTRDNAAPRNTTAPETTALPETTVGDRSPSPRTTPAPSLASYDDGSSAFRSVDISKRPVTNASDQRIAAVAADWNVAPPRWTFFSGVVNFLWIGAGPLYWGVLAAGLVINGWIGVAALSGVASLEPGYAGYGNAIMTVFLIAALGPVLAIVLSLGTSCCLVVMQYTANGATDITEWPQAPFAERFIELSRILYWVFLALGSSYLVGFALMPAFGDGATRVTTIVGAWLLFPFLTISALHSQRTLWPVSAVVLGSLFSLWWGWLIVYLQLAILGAICAAAAVFTFESSPYLTVLWTSPLLAAAMLIAARLFGRLLWRMSLRDADDETPRPTIYEQVVRPHD